MSAKKKNKQKVSHTKRKHRSRPLGAEMKMREEFWSDEVWKTLPEDDIYGGICYPPIKKPERV